MKMMQKSLLALAVMATTALNVQAASNVDVKVIGRIDPGTCTPTLSGGGVVDYGTMSPADLNATGYTLLANHQLDLAINCTAPTKVAVVAINGRPNTAAGVTEGSGQNAGNAPAGTTGGGVVGLGLQGTTKIGGYTLTLDTTSFTADGNSVATLNKRTNDPTTGTWTVANGTMWHVGTVKSYNTWGTAGTTTPAAFKDYNGKMNVRAYLNQKSAFDLTNTVHLDGLATLELVYLP
ncbi:DUF1120 domain-containing protein [Pantoea sp. Al-1710]|uniref:DUF1120 domain-containing protein n=1 Tax=Candidatus Pantoea communis TaxID=2608354 RepID=A0ABX0RU90_9GAMM|nr:DUF1120 domain-containing protein [Pantoea communis]NIG21012.1 DUF1120 domain-containing protein [Pantoea communis]